MYCRYVGSFLGGSVVKNPPANAGDGGDAGSILGSGRSPAVGNGNSLQHSFLENSTDRGIYSPWDHNKVKYNLTEQQEISYGVKKSSTQYILLLLWPFMKH